MEKKYKLTEETKNYNGHVLYRIKALRNFSNVKKGDLGGWVESEDNLSHKGDCWVYHEAMICGNAIVKDSAIATLNAIISDNSLLSECVAAVGNVLIYGNAKIYGKACISNNAKISGNAIVKGDVFIFDNAVVTGTAHITGTTKIGRNAIIKNSKDFINIDFSDENLTFYRTETYINTIYKHCSYNIKEFIYEIEKKHDMDLSTKYKSLAYSALLCMDSLEYLD